MKHTLTVVLLALSAFVLSACHDLLETSSSGKLTGQWQLMTIDTLATGGRLDMKEDRKYFGIEHVLFWIHDADGGQGFMATYAHEDSKLTLTHFTEFTQGITEEPEVEDVDELRPYGINALTETFDISLGSKTMVLDNGVLRITLRKF